MDLILLGRYNFRNADVCPILSASGLIYFNNLIYGSQSSGLLLEPQEHEKHLQTVIYLSTYLTQPSPDAAPAMDMLFIQMPSKVREHCSFSDTDTENIPQVKSMKLSLPQIDLLYFHTISLRGVAI